MSTSASDVSDELIRRLQALGFNFRDDGEDNDAIMLALSHVDLVRHDPGASQAGEIIWQGENLDGIVVVFADGTGKATLEYVEGNFPTDYLTKDSREFESEDVACRAARAAYDGDIDWDTVFYGDMDDLHALLDEESMENLMNILGDNEDDE